MRELTTDESSNIAKLIYNGDTLELTVTFKNGGIYRYKGMSLQHFGELCGAASIGSFFSTTVKKRYECEKVLPPTNTES